MSQLQRDSTCNGRIIALDGLRAIAVALVIAGHGVNAYWPKQAGALWLAPFVNASLGVRLFFVLSGFLITSLLWHEHQRNGSIDWRAFVLRRSLRIWPALYVYVVVMLVLSQGRLKVCPPSRPGACQHRFRSVDLTAGDARHPFRCSRSASTG